MTNTMSLHRRALALPLLFAVAACSGGSGRVSGSAAPPANRLDLFVNTQTGSDVTITGRLSVVALEAADGSFTTDLLPGDPEVTLSQPMGELTGPRLLDAPPGTYVAARLAFASRELAGVLADGTEVVIVLPQSDFRLPLSRPLVLNSGPQSWFTLHHDGPVELVRVGDELTWSPRWVAQTAEVELLRGARVRVTGFDAVRHLVDGRLLSMNELPVVLDLSRADELRRGDEMVGLDAFFAALRADDVLSVDGWLDQWGNVLVISAEVRDDDRRDQKSEVRGEVVELMPDRSSFLLHVLAIRKDRAGLPEARPLRLTVQVAARTKIKWVPRHGRHAGHLSFAALRVGMLVDVEWHGAAPEQRLTAHKVDIQCAARADLAAVVTGEVASVDAGVGSFVLAPKGRSDFRLGGERFDSLVVDVDDGSYLARRTDGRLMRITLNELVVGSHALAIVERVEGNRVRGLLVLVRE